MGVDPSAAVVYGIHFRYDRMPVTVTRYHEVTGKPYSKDTHESTQVLILKDGARVSFPEVPEELWDSFYDDGYCHGHDTGAMGIRLASLDCWNDTVEPLNVDMEGYERSFIAMIDKFFPTYRRQELIDNASLMLVNTTG